MSGRLLVTGASGLLGSCICARARAEGREVVALVRPGAETGALQDAGVRLVTGDVTDYESLRGAVRGVSGIVHAAALLGGTWARGGEAEFEAVNYLATVKLLQAAEVAEVQSMVVIGTIACLQTPEVPVSERSPIPASIPGESAYARTKRRAMTAAATRAAAGQQVTVVIPGAIYGPAPIAARALVPTSFNAAILAAARGELTRYARVPLPWSTSADVAAVALLALDRGRRGGRYLATGRMQDAITVAAFLNRACARAGSDRVVAEVAPTEDPGFDAEFGSMAAIARRVLPEPIVDNRATIAELGYAPTPVETGLAATVAWLRRLGELPAATETV